MTFAKNVLMDFNVQRCMNSGTNVEQYQQLYRQLRKSLDQGSRWTTLWDWTNKPCN